MAAGNSEAVHGRERGLALSARVRLGLRRPVARPGRHCGEGYQGCDIRARETLRRVQEAAGGAESANALWRKRFRMRHDVRQGGQLFLSCGVGRNGAASSVTPDLDEAVGDVGE